MYVDFGDDRLIDRKKEKKGRGMEYSETIAGRKRVGEWEKRIEERKMRRGRGEKRERSG